MLIDMIHDQPGEPLLKTRYRDPRVLAAYGYDAIVIPHALTAIPAAYEHRSARKPDHRGGLYTYHPRELESHIDAQVNAAIACGMKVFFHADALMLPRPLVMRRPADFLCDDPSGRLCPAKPAVLSALEDHIQELFDRWPAAAGLVMQTGDGHPAAVPHMVVSGLAAANCPACRGISLEQRLVALIGKMRDVVIGNLGKIHVHRACRPADPGTGGGRALSLQHDPQLYRAVSRQIGDSPDLIFSFPWDESKAHGSQGVNPCLFADRRPKWIEFQCAPELEAKGAFANYQAEAWKAFLGRLRAAAAAEGWEPGEVRERFSFWGWSRGGDGGWGGPHLGREEWIDANVHALAELRKNPQADVQDIATAWAGATFQIAESSPPAPAIAELLRISGAMIQKLLRPGAGQVRVESAAWVRDDLLDAPAIWLAAGRIVDAGIADAVFAEKGESLAATDRMRQLFDLALPELPNRAQARDLANTLLYLGSFAGTLAHLCRGFIRFAQWARGGRGDEGLAREAAAELRRAQGDWQQHIQRHALLPGAASGFHERGLWERTDGCLEELGPGV